MAAKLANAAGKMGKLIGTDLYLDGQGTNSSTLQIDGKLNAVVKFNHMLETPGIRQYAQA